jgi:hypothetical protein
MGNNQRGLWLE